MSWSDCGTDSKGRPIGYAHEATCDEPGCAERIDRGLGYACGGMHGEDEPEGSCERYFCGQHAFGVELPDGDTAFVCAECRDALGEEET